MNKINNYQVLIITAETGSGKTTQIPQYIFDYEIDNMRGGSCNIIVTQPRRISAMSISNRIAQERGQQLGDSVGYKVRFEEILPNPDGGILFCTTGMLLRMIISEDPFKRVNYLIIDEVHERNLETDLMLAIVKEVLPHRPNLKVILMSATIDTNIFSSYFSSSETTKISTKSYHVQQYFLDDIISNLQANQFPIYIDRRYEETYSDDEYDFSGDSIRSTDLVPYQIISSLIEQILVTSLGSILVFLPGWEQIQKMLKMMRELQRNFHDIQLLLVPLHSSVPYAEQRYAFITPDQKKARKIVLATDIAESSITIPDIVHVIDTGLVKQMRYITEKNMSSLDTIYTSQSNLTQRKGRAGRTCAGYHYCLIYNYDYSQLPLFNTPEIKRMDLQNVCLEVASMDKGSIRDFLRSTIEPPLDEQIESAIKRLQGLGALEKESITPLGRKLAYFPVNPSHARMILHSLLFQCLDPILTIVASCNTKDPFSSFQEKKRQATERRLTLSNNTNSDHMATLKAFNEWKLACNKGPESSDRFAEANFLSISQLQTISKVKNQLIKTLERCGLLSNYNLQSEHGEYSGERLWNLKSEVVELLRGLITPGLSPNIAYRLRKKNFMTQADKNSLMHPSSVNKKAPISLNSKFYVYQERLKTTKDFLIGTTQVSPISVFLFCESLSREDFNSNKYSTNPTINQSKSKFVKINEWIPILIEEEDLRLLQSARESVDFFFRYIFDENIFAQLHDSSSNEEITSKDTERLQLVKRAKIVINSLNNLLQDSEFQKS